MYAEMANRGKEIVMITWEDDAIEDDRCSCERERDRKRESCKRESERKRHARENGDGEKEI